MKRLRSILYTPGHRPDLIAKASRTGADGIGLVLEDSVPRDRRDEARAIVASAIGQLGDTRLVLVKVNGRDDPEHVENVSHRRGEVDKRGEAGYHRRVRRRQLREPDSARRQTPERLFRHLSPWSLATRPESLRPSRRALGYAAWVRRTL